MKQDIASARAGFTLVELLVVITILAIISITAYTSFSGATDKAKNSTKANHVASIETGLNAFFVEKNYYPMPSQYNATTNVWGYTGTQNAAISNTFIPVTSDNQIVSITSGAGGGAVYMSGTTGAANQIGAKGTIDSDVLAKQYLSQELVDPALKDTKVGNDKTLKDSGIGEYVYGVYAKNNTDWVASKKGSAYNMAIVVSDEQKGIVSKISGNFDKSTCINCPGTLIGSGTANINLRDGESYTGASTTDASARQAYPISGF